MMFGVRYSISKICSITNYLLTSDDVRCPVFDKQNMQHYELLVVHVITSVK